MDIKKSLMLVHRWFISHLGSHVMSTLNCEIEEIQMNVWNEVLKKIKTKPVYIYDGQKLN